MFLSMLCCMKLKRNPTITLQKKKQICSYLKIKKAGINRVIITGMLDKIINLFIGDCCKGDVCTCLSHFLCFEKNWKNNCASPVAASEGAFATIYWWIREEAEWADLADAPFCTQGNICFILRFWGNQPVFSSTFCVRECNMTVVMPPDWKTAIDKV